MLFYYLHNDDDLDLIIQTFNYLFDIKTFHGLKIVFKA